MASETEKKSVIHHLHAGDKTTESPRCSFVVTGFGPFAGVSNNPTSTLISCLRKTAEQLPVRETHILDTSADAAKQAIQGIYSRLCSGILNKISSRSNLVHLQADGVDIRAENHILERDFSIKDIVVMLHIGVNYRGTLMQLEQCAYNDATFRVPDNNDYQPQLQCILENSTEFGRCLRTTLDLDEICNELHRQGYTKCCISKDAGRFVCNYTYCLSLDQCQSFNDALFVKGGQQSRELVECHSLFLHVPPFDKMSETDQMLFIIKLMETIDKSVSKTTRVYDIAELT